MDVGGGVSIEGLLSLGQPCSPSFWPLTGVRVQCTVQTARSDEKTSVMCMQTNTPLQARSWAGGRRSRKTRQKSLQVIGSMLGGARLRQRGCVCKYTSSKHSSSLAGPALP